MLGWEFPPFISGGLGTACYGLTRAMSKLGAEIVFILPRDVEGAEGTHVRMTGPMAVTRAAAGSAYRLREFTNVVFRTVGSGLSPYQTPQTYQEQLRRLEAEHWTTQELSEEFARLGRSAEHYGADLFTEVQRYARLATVIARDETFDVVHAHDWMTFAAGMAVSATTGRPLVVHVHSTEFDRSGEHVNQRIYDLERQGLQAAAHVIAVSHLTRQIIINRYAVPAEKVSVVYNAVDMDGRPLDTQRARIRRDEKIVLFLGRITMQKGPEYFLAAAKKVLEVMDNVKFIMAGTGDMIRRTIELAAEMGIGHKVLFTGFLRGEDVDKIFGMADLFVMPSVSEPFGLVPVEALRNDVPVIISKQSGIAEVLTHALKVDFWDINEMANKILAVLRHPPLQATLREHGNFEVRKFSWEDSGRRCLEIYEALLAPV